MQRVIFFSGIWNAVVGAVLIAFGFEPRLGVPIPLFWALAVGGFICSRDLPRLAAFVYWEAALRFFSAALVFTLGRGVLGALPAWFMASTDLAWGLIYVIGMRRR
jgi:hypothetical protein